MKLGIYAVYDNKAAVFAHPFYFQSDGVAVRAFTDLVNRVEGAVASHPEDYTLFKIGQFDDSEGTLIDCQNVMLASALSVKKVVPAVVESAPIEVKS